MWKVYSDDYLLYATTLEAYRLADPVLIQEVNKIDRFSFTIFSEHPNYSHIDKLKSVITVYRDSDLYFRGRVINDTVGVHNERKIECEGELAFLVDTIQRPFSFPIEGTDDASPEAYLSYLIGQHNSQVDSEHQFTVGNVTVTDANDYISRSDTEYSTTWQLINEGLLNTVGGYISVRHEDGVSYIDYLSDFSVLSDQPVEFGLNILGLSKERKGEDIATAIVPLGAKDEETGLRLTISSITDAVTGDICKSGDMVYSLAAEQQYGGRIQKAVVWDDVTTALRLYNKATAYLQSKAIVQPETIELSAADLSGAGYDYNNFKIGVKYRVTSPVHSLSDTWLIRKLTTRLDNPSANKMTFGTTSYSFTEQNKRRQEQQMQEIKANVEIQTTRAILEMEQRTSSQLLQNNEAIIARVSDGYYAKGDVDSLISGVSTEITQNAEAVQITFSQLQQNLDDVAANADAEFTELHRYVRIENGEMQFGSSDSAVSLAMDNDRISFRQSGAEVSYYANNKFSVYDGEFLNSLQLGRFAFIPRQNGNLSFKKVVS